MVGLSKTNKMEKVNKITPKKLAIGGIVAILVTVLFRWGLVSFLVKEAILAEVKLEPGSQLWHIWKDIPIPIFSKFYFFNVTNPDEVSMGAKPKFVEVGPYVYQEKRSKIILESNDTVVKYRPKQSYFFRPELSVGSDDDFITLLNIPFVGVARMAWELSKEPFVLSTLDDMLADKGERLFHTNRVREYLFDGVSISSYMELLSLPVVSAFGPNIKIPKRLLDGDFGFFDDKNATADEPWVIETGKYDITKFGKIVSYNGMTKLDAWDEDKCNALRGTDGTIFPPFADTSRTLQMFHPDLCRSVNMVYHSPGEFMGLSTLRFSFEKAFFESVSLHEENKCFCKNTWEWCEKGGVVPVGACYGGAPLYLSKPHFMDAPKEYRDKIDSGLKTGDYDTFLQLEPNIGLPIKANLKIQMNVELQPYEAMETFLNAPDMMFPVIWMEETAEITEVLAAPLKLMVKILHVLNVISWMTLLVSGSAVLGAMAWSFVRYKCAKKP